MAATLSRRFLRMALRSYKLQMPMGIDLPIRFRPWFVAFTFLVMIFLALLGFTNIANDWPLDDKILHFLCMGFATFVFYWIVDVDEEARRIWMWRYFGLIFSGFVCLLLGGVVSEFIQSTLPYKTFQWGDVLANLLGSSVGLYSAFKLERYYRHRREIARLYQPLGDDEDSESEAELLPTSSKPANAPKRVRNVWDSREDFEIGEEDSDGDYEEDRRRTNTQQNTFPPKSNQPIQIVVSQA